MGAICSPSRSGLVSVTCKPAEKRPAHRGGFERRPAANRRIDNPGIVREVKGLAPQHRVRWAIHDVTRAGRAVRALAVCAGGGATGRQNGQHCGDDQRPTNILPARVTQPHEWRSFSRDPMDWSERAALRAREYAWTRMKVTTRSRRRLGAELCEIWLIAADGLLGYDAGLGRAIAPTMTPGPPEV